MSATESVRDRDAVTATTKSTLRILALDDDPFMRELLGRVLARIGFASVVTCGSARQALEYLDAMPERVDLILLDLIMPEMDGVEFIRHLVARRYPGQILLLSGEEPAILQCADELLHAQGIPSLGHLRKPVDLDALATLIERWTPLTARPAAERRRYSMLEVEAAIDGGTLVNHYQPKVALCDGRVVGVECLVRWQHPRDGLVYPDQFITVAEEHGLIGRLTRRVFQRALADGRAWNDCGLAMPLAVNVSMSDLTSLEFPDILARGAHDHGVEASDVILEVTESQLMRNARATLDVLTRLRMKRFRMAIDDFGTGHSTLAQLRILPIDELKVDRSFVHGAEHDPKARAILEASRRLAGDLGLGFVAEGVEDLEDWNYLRRIGCQYAQGYFIGKPMPAAALADWVDAWGRRVRDWPGGFGSAATA